jgi:hypothetical protein
MRKARLALAGLAVTGVVGLGFAVPALAQDDGATSSPSPTSREQLRAERETDFAERLAKKLGLDTGKVQDALTAVREEMQAEAKADRLEALKERLDQAVEDGKLTREQADAILEAAEQGVLSGGRGFGGRDGHGRFGGFGPFGPESPGVTPSPSGTSTPSVTPGSFGTAA